MAGSGDRLPATVEQVARLGISRHFHFTGFLTPEEVQRLLSISDVFVMPSVSEPFGIVPLEAMRFGVPVILSRQSGVSEIIRYAMKTDFWDSHSIAEAILGLIHYPALSGFLIRKGKEEAGSLNWEQAAEEVFKIYRQLNYHYHVL
jgi:glycosyltransferase involved in cell wall biosynthesis